MWCRWWWKWNQRGHGRHVRQRSAPTDRPAREGAVPAGEVSPAGNRRCPKDPFDPIGLVGRVEAQPISLTVVEEAEAKLTPEAVRQLVADLTAKDSDTRLKAVYRVPPTTNEEVLAALVGLLADPHEAQATGFSVTPVFVRPVASAASGALPAQGPAAIGPLLAFAAKPTNAAYREQVADILGKLGPDKRSAAFLRDFVDRVARRAVQHCPRARPARLGCDPGVDPRRPGWDAECRCPTTRD